MGWDTPRSPVLDGTRIWSGVSWLRKQFVEVRFDWHHRTSGCRPQALTLLGGAKFIAWRLRRLFLRECQRNPMHFWRYQACLGYDLRPDTSKKVWYHSRPVGGTNDKYRLSSSSQTWQFRSDTSTCCAHAFILYICSVHSIHLFHLLFLLPCLVSGPFIIIMSCD